MNPCPCGYPGDPEKECTCSPTLISRYQKRLSGPLLDRIDIHIEVPRVPFQKLSDDRRGEPSAAIRARVEGARARQTARFSGAGAGGGPCYGSFGADADLVGQPESRTNLGAAILLCAR
jgi:magnesium chelatase family protein